MGEDGGKGRGTDEKKIGIGLGEDEDGRADEEGHKYPNDSVNKKLID